MDNSVSKLAPFYNFIKTERKRRTTYRRIAELLAEKGIEVDHSTIHAFVRVRSKPPRKVITMWESEEHSATPAEQLSSAEKAATKPAAAEQNVPELAGQLDAIQRLKQAKPNTKNREKGLPSFREDAPLERLSDEEARRLRDGL